MSSSHDVITLEPTDVIDLSELREPTVGEVVRQPAIRRAAARSLHDLDLHVAHAPWVLVAVDEPELLAASPSFDGGDARWTERLDEGVRRVPSDVPVALIPLGEPLEDGSPAASSAQLVVHALCEIVVAEHRAAAATARAGRAEALASTDALTGLANQRAWWHRIAEEDARIERSESPAVVAVVDLDDLKKVNDERGHLHGDLLLRLTAQTLRHLVRACDIVARVGGDEFAVLAVDYNGDAELLVKRIRAALDEAEINGSVGAAAPEPGGSLVDAYERADRAMYEQKRARRSSAEGA